MARECSDMLEKAEDCRHSFQRDIVFSIPGPKYQVVVYCVRRQQWELPEQWDFGSMVVTPLPTMFLGLGKLTARTDKPQIKMHVLAPS